MWILGSIRQEMLFLVLPGLLSIMVAMVAPQFGETSLLYGLFATAVLDSGHVYTTAWRTYLHSDEWKTHKAYIWVPVFFFLLFTIWYYTRIPYMWSAIVYSTLYHHVRQSYGLSKWYQSINKRSDKVSDKFLYALAILPFITYHFREGVVKGYYSYDDLFIIPNLTNLRIFQVIYALTLLSWICYEISLWRKGIKEVNRIISVALPSFIFFYCFMVGSTITQTLLPLHFVHAAAYFGILGQTLNRTQKRFNNYALAIGVVLITAFIFGLSEAWLEENMSDLLSGKSALFSACAVGISLTPLYCHYAFDAIIWKHSHREAVATFRKN